METEMLEKQLEGFEYVRPYCGYDLLAKRNLRIVYDPKTKEIVTRYRVADKVARGKIRV